MEGRHAWRTPTLVRRSHGTRPRAGGVLAAGLRGHLAGRPDRRHGHQQAQSLCRLREQRGTVRQGSCPLPRRSRRLRRRRAGRAHRPRGHRAADPRGHRPDRRREHAPGCLCVKTVHASGPDAHAARQDAVAVRKAGEAALRRRLEQATDLPSRHQPAALAALVHTISDGIAVQAAAGRSRDELRRIGTSALRTLLDEGA